MNEKTNDGFDIIAERIKAGRDFREYLKTTRLIST